jgi:hypothetical protein
MKIGDLVKYDKSLSGLENCMGLIIAYDGLVFVVQWFDRHTKRVTEGSEKTRELPEFLEVVSQT